MSGTDDPTHVYWDLENRKGLWARGEAMSETPTARALLRVGYVGEEDELLARLCVLASRVEAVLAFCLTDEVNFSADLEHTDPVVRALARGRVSAAEQVLRLLDGKRTSGGRACAPTQIVAGPGAVLPPGSLLATARPPETCRICGELHEIKANCPTPKDGSPSLTPEE